MTGISEDVGPARDITLDDALDRAGVAADELPGIEDAWNERFGFLGHADTSFAQMDQLLSSLPEFEHCRDIRPTSITRAADGGVDVAADAVSTAAGAEPDPWNFTAHVPPGPLADQIWQSHDREVTLTRYEDAQRELSDIASGLTPVWWLLGDDIEWAAGNDERAHAVEALTTRPEEIRRTLTAQASAAAAREALLGVDEHSHLTPAEHDHAEHVLTEASAIPPALLSEHLLRADEGAGDLLARPAEHAEEGARFAAVFDSLDGLIASRLAGAETALREAHATLDKWWAFGWPGDDATLPPRPRS
jgi:hypothetical protein